MNRLRKPPYKKDIGALERHILASRDIATQMGDPFLSISSRWPALHDARRRRIQENDLLKSSYN